MAVTTGFSYAPKMQNELASLAPITFGSGLKFSSESPIAFRDQNLSAPSEGYYSGKQALVEGVTKGILSALEGVTGAYVGKRQKEIDKAEAEEKATIEHTRALELANLRLPTEEEEKLEKAYKQAQIANLNKQVSDRRQEAIPENAQRQVRPPGFFKQDQPIDLKKEAQKIDWDTPLPATTPSPETTPNQSYWEIDMPEPMAGQKGIVKAPPKAGYFEMDIPEPMTQPLAELNALPTVQTPQVLAMQGTTLPLAPISGAEKQPPITMQTSPTSVRPQVVTTPPPLAATEPIQKPPAQQAPQVNPAEYLDYLTSLPYESPADAYEAQQRLASLFPEDKFNLAEIETVKDTTTGQRIYYVNPPVKKVQPAEGMVLTDFKETDGKVTKTYKPAVPIEKQITQVEAPLKGMQAVLDAIQDIKGIYGGLSPGVGGAASVLKYVPSSDAWNVSELLKPIYANNAFQTLMEMKAASPTGGALGAVSETELQLLINSVAALGQNLDAEYFGRNLLKLEEGIKQTKAAIENRVTELKGGGKSKIIEGQKAKGPNGEMIIYKGGKWVQMQ
jgi:hypothetical protein